MGVTIKEGPKSKALTGAQALVLIALISGKNKQEAAKAAGVHPQAVSEMLKQHHFVEALHYSNGKLIDQATSEIGHLVKEAMGVLAQTLQSDEPALQFRAATYVIDHFLVPQAKQGVSSAQDCLDTHGHNGKTVKQPAVSLSVNEALQYLKENPNEHKAVSGT